MRNLRTKTEQAVAYHEAGHAVVGHYLGLKLGRKGVTIIPDKQNGTYGSTDHLLGKLRRMMLGHREVTPSLHVRIENQATMLLAWDIAERKFFPRRRFGGHTDIEHAADLLDFIGATQERLKVAEVLARLLVERRWRQIVSVANALCERKTLTPGEVEQAIKAHWSTQ